MNRRGKLLLDGPIERAQRCERALIVRLAQGVPHITELRRQLSEDGRPDQGSVPFEDLFKRAKPLPPDERRHGVRLRRAALSDGGQPFVGLGVRRRSRWLDSLLPADYIVEGEWP